MSPMLDSALQVRDGASAGTIDASTATVISKEIEGTGLNGLALYLFVPAAVTGCAPKLSVDIHASTTSAAATTDVVIASRSGIAENAAGAWYVIPFTTDKRSVAFAFNVTGGSSPAFSNIDAYIGLNVSLDWKRTNETH